MLLYFSENIYKLFLKLFTIGKMYSECTYVTFGISLNTLVKQPTPRTLLKKLHITSTDATIQVVSNRNNYLYQLRRNVLHLLLK